ncbi:rhomboid family intramembrane serine protease [uncultured Kordia sp.]|uniref:rhomboid family intramembrane serine protease n=1 Tax=uncultured Kordia sp. TaxID=507699 RepID=UPI00262FA5EB|nr:rhomboid family intramembrane serine protease [uncultured Kordia sp.]
MMNLELVTIGIIIANVLVSIKGFDDYEFRNKYIYNIGAIQNGQHYRMITSGFLHANPPHLFFNMLTLYFFADIVISNFGQLNFVLIYFASLLLGSLLSFFFHQKEYHYTALGASGAVTGILYAAILLYPNMELFIMFIPIPIKAYIFGILYLVFSIYGMKKQLGNIGHDAHFGGAVAGFVITLALRTNILYTDTYIVIAMALPIIALFVMIKTGKI